MCKANQKKHPIGLAPGLAPKGRNLGPHWDSSGYLEVIITIGIFGEVDVQLTIPPAHVRSSDILPRERKEGVTIGPGFAYAIWGKARWKMYHDAIVGVTERAVPGMHGETGRVGLTLRFFRRSFAHVFATMHAVGGPAPTRPLVPSELTCGQTIVDALYYDMSGRRVNEHQCMLHTPAPPPLTLTGRVSHGPS